MLQCDTSTATAHAAAIAVLARQYYTEGYYPSGMPVDDHRICNAESGALIKATLLNSARYKIGTPINYPNDTEGWGVVVLDHALRFPSDAHQLLVSDVRKANGLMTGEQSSVTVPVASSAAPLKVTLVWTDLPGEALVNDLDLVVKSPNGTQTFLGNHFAGDVSTTGGAKKRPTTSSRS